MKRRSDSNQTPSRVTLGNDTFCQYEGNKKLSAVLSWKRKRPNLLGGWAVPLLRGICCSGHIRGIRGCWSFPPTEKALPSPQARSDASRKKKGPEVLVTTGCPLWLESGRIPHGFRSLSRKLSPAGPRRPVRWAGEGRGVSSRPGGLWRGMTPSLP